MPLHRRTFLKSIITGSPILAEPLLSRLASAQQSSAPTSAIHVVPAGRDRLGPPHTLGFSSLAFKVLTSDTGGNLFIIEHRNLMPGTGPALHLHFSQDEWFYVMEGKVAFRVGEQRVQLNAGESVLGPRRIPHTFSAVGSPAHLLIAFSPAGKMEQYFIDAAAHLSLAATDSFMDRYEMQWVGPSPFWKS